MRLIAVGPNAKVLVSLVTLIAYSLARSDKPCSRMTSELRPQNVFDPLAHLPETTLQAVVRESLGALSSDPFEGEFCIGAGDLRDIPVHSPLIVEQGVLLDDPSFLGQHDDSSPSPSLKEYKDFNSGLFQTGLQDVSRVTCVSIPARHSEELTTFQDGKPPTQPQLLDTNAFNRVQSCQQGTLTVQNDGEGLRTQEQIPPLPQTRPNPTHQPMNEEPGALRLTPPADRYTLTEEVTPPEPSANETPDSAYLDRLLSADSVDMVRDLEANVDGQPFDCPSMPWAPEESHADLIGAVPNRNPHNCARAVGAESGKNGVAQDETFRTAKIAPSRLSMDLQAFSFAEMFGVSEVPFTLANDSPVIEKQGDVRAVQRTAAPGAKCTTPAPRQIRAHDRSAHLGASQVAPRVGQAGGARGRSRKRAAPRKDAADVKRRRVSAADKPAGPSNSGEASTSRDAPIADFDLAQPTSVPVSGKKPPARRSGPRRASKKSTTSQRTGEPDKASVSVQPSRFCHICLRRHERVSLLACSNSRLGTCRKVVCEKCFENFNWDWTYATNPLVNWTCTHCRNICPPRAQCHIYKRTNNRRHQALIKKREQTDPGSSQPAETNEPTAAASNAMAAVAAPAQVLATAAPSSHAPSRAQHPIAALPGGIAFAASLQAPEIQDCPPHLASEPLKPETLQIQHSNLAQAGEIGIMDGTQMLYSSSLLSPPLPENHADGEAYLGVKYEHN